MCIAVNECAGDREWAADATMLFILLVFYYKVVLDSSCFLVLFRMHLTGAALLIFFVVQYNANKDFLFYSITGKYISVER